MYIKILIITLLLSKPLFADKPDLFLLKTYDDTKEVVGWVMSEKLDGVRAFWDGEKLISRGGNTFIAPKWFIKDFPAFALDGELWTKRGDFENISSIVRRKIPDKRWQQLSYNIFEVPKQSGGLLDRLSILEIYLHANTSQYLKLIPQQLITSKKQLQSFLQKITLNGGEGVVVRNPITLYKTGRLSSALKLKEYLDTECIIEKILSGKGKYVDKMGSVICKMESGRWIRIGSGFKDKDRENPPKIGTTITFKYYGLTKNGMTRFPVFLRTRTVD